jgi:hypothetical protein
MYTDKVEQDLPATWIRIKPFTILVWGVVFSLLAGVLNLAAGESLVVLRGLALFASFLCVIGMVSVQLQITGWSFEERTRSSGFVLGASLVCLFNLYCMDESWDTLIMAVKVMIAIGLFGCSIILLPTILRKIAISVLMLVHFTAILTAVTCVAPPGGAPPWISFQLWSRVFRPYLYFFYLNNAYHFYSPEPGPAQLLWFYVKFEDGSAEWLHVPDRDDYFTRQEYQRMLSLTESANWYGSPFVSEVEIENRLRSRNTAANLFSPTITPCQEGLAHSQYLKLGAYQRQMTASFARYVARHYQSKKHTEAPVKSVKVYRVTHIIVEGPDMADKLDPNFPNMFWPYYHGEFDRDGNLLDPDDPFLYWLIPYDLKAKPNRKINPEKFRPEDVDVVDQVEIHAKGLQALQQK